MLVDMVVAEVDVWERTAVRRRVGAAAFLLDGRGTACMGRSFEDADERRTELAVLVRAL